MVVLITITGTNQAGATRTWLFFLLEPIHKGLWPASTDLAVLENQPLKVEGKTQHTFDSSLWCRQFSIPKKDPRSLWGLV